MQDGVAWVCREIKGTSIHQNSIFIVPFDAASEKLAKLTDWLCVEGIAPSMAREEIAARWMNPRSRVQAAFVADP
jgi:hypothetical protein